MAEGSGTAKAGKTPEPDAGRIREGAGRGAAGTGGSASGTSGGPSGTSGWPPLREVYATFVVIALAIGVSNTFTRVTDYAGAGRPIPVWVSALWELTSIISIGIVLPAVLAVTRRFPISRDRPWRWLAAHAIATVPYTLAHSLMMGTMRWAIYLLYGESYPLLRPIGQLLYEYRKDVLSYGGTVLIYCLWRSYRGARAPEPAPAVAEPLEVRDGTRRTFVEPADIVWVEAAGNYAELHLVGRSLLHRATLADLETRLAGDGFVRIHRGRLVNRARVAGYETNAAGDFTLTLTDGRTLAGSRRYRGNLDRAAP